MADVIITFHLIALIGGIIGAVLLLAFSSKPSNHNPNHRRSNHDRVRIIRDI